MAGVDSPSLFLFVGTTIIDVIRNCIMKNPLKSLKNDIALATVSM